MAGNSTALELLLIVRYVTSLLLLFATLYVVDDAVGIIFQPGFCWENAILVDMFYESRHCTLKHFIFFVTSNNQFCFPQSFSRIFLSLSSWKRKQTFHWSKIEGKPVFDKFCFWPIKSFSFFSFSHPFFCFKVCFYMNAKFDKLLSFWWTLCFCSWKFLWP